MINIPNSIPKLLHNSTSSCYIKYRVSISLEFLFSLFFFHFACWTSLPVICPRLWLKLQSIQIIFVVSQGLTVQPKIKNKKNQKRKRR